MTATRRISGSPAIGKRAPDGTLSHRGLDTVAPRRMTERFQEHPGGDSVPTLLVAGDDLDSSLDGGGARGAQRQTISGQQLLLGGGRFRRRDPPFPPVLLPPPHAAADGLAAG